MIYILHGEDSTTSYNRLRSLIKSYPQVAKVLLDKKNTTEDYLQALLTQDLVETQKIITLENFLLDKKVTAKNLKNIPKDKLLIFWEKNKLHPSKARSLNSIARVEEFKMEPTIFYFLDSLSSDPRRSLKFLQKMSAGEYPNLLWLLINRVLLLILAKTGSSAQDVFKITSRPIQAWQWQKIISQTQNLKLSALYKIFTGLLKIDYIIKKGRTELDQNLLVSMLLLKYLSR